MEASRLIFAFLFLAYRTNAFIITHMIDYRDFSEKCVTQYVQNRHFNLPKYCRHNIDNYKRSFYESIEVIVKGQQAVDNKTALECAINQLKLYNVSEVLLKAIAYKYDPAHFVSFEAIEKSCDGIVISNNVSVITDRSGFRVMVVILGERNKSRAKLQHCLNDLFRKYLLNKLILYDDETASVSEIGLRSFGKHAITFLEQLAEIAQYNCKSYDQMSDDDLNRVELLRKIVNSPVGNFTETFHELTAVDLFGFTQPSINVERCIIDDFRWRFFNNQSLFYRIFHEADEKTNLHKKLLKEFNKIVLSCLKFF